MTNDLTNYRPGEWFQAKSRDELQAFFLSRLPAIREAAQNEGYAIGVHGSLRRDLDLIAAPWRDGAADVDMLAHAVAMAACGITRDGNYEWEAKPMGRIATSIPCCWATWHNEPGTGHIDMSVTPAIHDQALADMHKQWAIDDRRRVVLLEDHLRQVLEVARTWQPDYATAMDRKTLELAAKEVGHQEHQPEPN